MHDHQVRPSTDWLERAAHALYEKERVEHPDRNLPDWASAPRALRVDARYRATAAHMRGDETVKAALVEHVAATIAVLNGFIWPACDSRTAQIMPPEQYAAVVAERRQGFLHQARLVVAAMNRYLDVDAVSESRVQREGLLAKARGQRDADTLAVKKWKHVRDFGFGVPFVEGVQ